MKPFKEAFPGLIIKDNELNNIAALLNVERVALCSRQQMLKICVHAETWVHKKHIYALEKLLKSQLFADTPLSVYIEEHFTLSALYTAETLLDQYKKSIETELKKENRIMYQVFRSGELSFPEEDRVVLNLTDTPISRNYGGKLKDLLEEILTVRCSLPVECFVRYGREEGRSLLSESAAMLEEEARQVSRKAGMVSESGGDEPAEVRADQPQDTEAKDSDSGKDGKKKKGKDRKKYKSSNPDVFYGRDITEDSVPIVSLDESVTEAVVLGQIAHLEVRELKSGKLLYIMSVTDFTDTINVKLFLSPEEAEEISGKLKAGSFIKLKGRVSLDAYEKELAITNVFGIKKAADFRDTRKDVNPDKRIELHCHTKMSDMDGVSDVKDIVKRAWKWGQKAIAVTDHGVVQAFPDANHAMEDIESEYLAQYKAEHPDATKEELAAVSAPFKVIYGCEIYLVDDKKDIVSNSRGQSLSGTFVVFDLETTGFSPKSCKIIEIGAVKVTDGRITDRFSTFVNPKMPIPLRIEQLTDINDNMVISAPEIEEVLPEFVDFCGDAIMVAHNAEFDMSFIYKNCEDMGIRISPTVIDTVALSRALLPDLHRFRLETVAKHLNVPLLKHHRAVDDAECTAEIFKKLCGICAEKGIYDLDALNAHASVSVDLIKKMPYYHAVVLAKNETGRVNLYTLISKSHLDYYYRRPRVPKSVYMKYSEGLMIGSACQQGELYQALLRSLPEEEIAKIVDFYDYLEVQPLGNNEFLIADEDNDRVKSRQDLIDINKEIISLGEKAGKPVVATGDVHFLDPEDEIYRRIIMAGQGFADADQQAPLYLRTTAEMLEEFSYLDSETARKVVIDDPAKVADMCEKISPIRAGKFPPIIENSDSDLRRICYDKAHEMYGRTLPAIVEQRLERELNSIISNGYAVMYIIAQKLVWKSNEDGYLVGSRGSVGSSFVATMAGITEVNPLPPHYLCPQCHYVDFDSETVIAYSDKCGSDMPDAVCPVCGTPLKKVGFNIPFETFLGFKGNKEPDIDLNFSGEYQAKAHRYTEVIFGKGQTFKAGTIGTVAEKTAFGFVRKYYEERNIFKRNCEIERIAEGCTGIRRSTGQHPGGIIVLPLGENINSFTPVQHPANDTETDIITTHFDYHSIDSNLLKLDILGHDDPTMMKMLTDLTGVDPTGIPLDDRKVMSLFKNTEALGITPEDIGGCLLGCLGVPEFGTEFAMTMLMDTKPEYLSDLVRIAGLAHGTDVWLGNAQTLIEEGIADISTCICNRDDIMTSLIARGLDSEQSFTIMESVRKGKGLKPDWEKVMREHDVPEWYIDSCKKIKYMFPKAHAAAYVMMAFRIAWFKVYYPEAYYASYFSIRASGFSYDKMCRGKERLLSYIADYEARKDTLNATEKDTLRDMRIAREMYARGIEIIPADIYESDAHRFRIVDGKLLPSLDKIEGMGEKAAEAVKAAAADGKFMSKDDFRTRTKVTKTVIDYMDQQGMFGDLPETDQMSVFDLLK